MTQNKLTFQSENLVVDYISFNISGYGNTESIAKYLFKTFNFNSTFTKGKNGTSKSWFYLKKNQHQVSFRQLEYDPASKSFWEGTTIHFSGNNAAHFYKIVQAQKFDWNILKLKNASLGRIDVHYFRKFKITDQDDQLENFMEKCCQRIRSKSKRRKAKWGLESNGLVLRIGNRSSSNYYRVYQKHKGLQFELELKNQVVKSFQKLLTNNSIEEFEHKLSKHFYRQSFESLNLNSNYMDWLLHWYRQSSPKQNTIGLLTTYLKNDNKELTFNFLRFLSFLQSQTKKSYTRSFDDQVYYMIRFPLSDFIIYTGADHKSHYQRKKALQIFKDLEAFQIFKLQTFTLEDFDDFEFCSSVIIPYLKVKKNGRLWTVNVAIAKELYEYKYPFQFNEYFLTWKTNYQFQVKSQIIAITATDYLKKEFYIQEFLTKFNVSNTKKAQIKQMLIEAINQQINNQLIQPQFKIIQKDGSVKRHNKLQVHDIGQIELIYFYETVDYKSLF